MKSILMSIQPKWVEKIFNGEKTIEVRKSAPKPPFKVVVYETKGKKYKYNVKHCQTQNCNDCKANGCYEGIGKVIGEFICDKVNEINYEAIEDYSGAMEDVYMREIEYEQLCKNACLSYDEMFEYSKGTNVKALHITALKVYDKPKELGEITTYTTRRRYTTKKAKEFTGDGINIEKLMHGNRAEARVITKPPQSWQYVGEIEE